MSRVKVLQDTLTLQKLFHKDKPSVLIPHLTNFLTISKPQNDKFQNIANKLLLQTGFKDKIITTTTSPQQETIVPRELPHYTPITYKPHLLKTNSIDIKAENYLQQLTKDDIQILQRRQLPYLPSQYTKSPNYIWPGPDVPFVQSRSDIKGVLVPFALDYKLLRNVQFQIHNTFFNLKFIPADNISAVARKSKPSIFVIPSNQLLFNKFQHIKLSSKTTSSDYFPSNISAQRRRTYSFYKKLYWQYLTRKEKIIDGLLVIRCKKLLNSVDDFHNAELLFKKFIKPVHTMKVVSKRNLSPREFEHTCKQFGLPHEKLFANFL